MENENQIARELYARLALAPVERSSAELVALRDSACSPVTAIPQCAFLYPATNCS